MYAERRVDQLEPDENTVVRNAIEALPKESDRIDAAKDIHLVELALAADQRVLSHDRRARQVFGLLAQRNGEVATIHWAGPAEEGCCDWLRNLAPEGGPFRLSGAGPK